MHHLISVQTAPLIRRLGDREAFKAFRAAGFEALDYGICDLTPFQYAKNGEGESFFNKPDEEILAHFREAARMAKEEGIRIGQTHSPFPCCDYVDKKPVVTEHNLRLARLAIQITQILDCSYMVLHPIFTGAGDYDNDPELRADMWEKNRAFYLTFLPELREYGVKICVENMWGGRSGHIVPSLMSHAEEMARWIDALNAEAGEERFCACLDTGHCYLTGDDPAESIRILGARLQRLHMHDVQPDRDLHTVPFTGMAKWEEIAAALREVGYAGTINFEAGGFADRVPAPLTVPATNYLGTVADYVRNLVDAE